MSFNLLNHKSIFIQPSSVIRESFWKEYFPLAYLLIEILRPGILVELGVYQGGSFNVFCDAVKTLKTGTKCYGVDNWQGDPHNQYYDISVYDELSDFHRRQYPEISALLKMEFDEALHEFPDHTVDLLHIDGYHRYDAVKHDFENWLPKMGDQGVVIFHDTNYRERDYGVWKLWEEIAGNYPSYEFKFGCGLGLLAVGPKINPVFRSMLDEFNANSFYHSLFEKLGTIYNLTTVIEDADHLLQLKESQLHNLGRELIAVNERLIDMHGQRDSALYEIESRGKQLIRAEERFMALQNSFEWKLGNAVVVFARKYCPAPVRNFFRKILEKFI